jgi:sugar phosphate isomerase/epimerase
MDGLHIDPYHMDLDKDIPRIRDFAKSNGMYVELGSSGTSPEELTPYIKAAEKTGAKLLRIFIGGSCLDGREIVAERTKKAKKELEQAVKIAEAADVDIAVENHGDVFLEDLENIMEIDSNNIGICYDSGNFAFTGEDPLEAVEILGDRIICTHIKDVCEEQKFPDAKPFATVKRPVHFCALGEGNLPIRKIVDAILAKKPDINITLEICSPARTDLDEAGLLQTEEQNVIKSVRFMRRQY